jgi:hypothetical protein
MTAFDSYASSQTAQIECAVTPSAVLAPWGFGTRRDEIRGTPQAGSEFRPAAEAELLHPVVGFLAERECIIEPQRPEW